MAKITWNQEYCMSSESVNFECPKATCEGEMNVTHVVSRSRPFIVSFITTDPISILVLVVLV
jgi:hypothetical protein